MIVKEITVTNRLGLHARAAATLVRAIANFKSNITLEHLGNGLAADAKSILKLLMLSASQGAALRLMVEGPDEVAAANEIMGIFAGGFGEEEQFMVRARRRGPPPQNTWHGLGVSEGVVIGRVMRLFDGTPQVFRISLPENELEREVHRLRAAVRLARRQLLAIKTRAEREFGKQHAYIFDAHLLMVRDHKLLDDLENFIRRERLNAEWAVKVTSDRIAARYAEMDDEYLRERRADVADVTQRIIKILCGERNVTRQVTESIVIVAEDLLPSALADLDLTHTRAIALDAGGWTSHTAIIARALGIPAVVGLRNLHPRARTGDVIVVDAHSGTVVLHPTLAAKRHYEKLAGSHENFAGGLGDDDKAHSLETLDRVPVTLRANLELPAEYASVKRYGARGVGLYRSEFLLTQSKTLPDEETQRRAYVELAQLAGAEGATIRLFDLGGDKISDATANLHQPERNPALGLRAIRLAFSLTDLFRVQVRAVLRAATEGTLQMVLPMVADVADVRQAKAIIAAEREALINDGIAVGSVQIGAMIELPAAAMLAHHLAREVDFFSLGTNDLIQYTLAVDRGNEAVAPWFRTLHPAVLQGIAHTLRAARAAGIRAVVCGEMAATPTYAVILLGLGATELSMMPPAMPRMRRVLSSIAHADAQLLAHQALECATADETEMLVAKEFATRWPHLFGAHNLPRQFPR